MLRSEIPFPLDKKLARFVAFLLGEAFLGFLAIISVALTLLQMCFRFPSRATSSFNSHNGSSSVCSLSNTSWLSCSHRTSETSS